MEVPTNRSRVVLQVAVFSLICSFSFVFAGDIVHQDDIAPKWPGCDNNFVLVGGVTPKKGGTEHLGLPVFNTVADAFGTEHFVLSVKVKAAFLRQSKTRLIVNWSQLSWYH
ncbi:putative succinate--CoA ligase (ADP-forming) [Helianthus annuus]|nr:putative succinate--CoA ligase (ADP-forming) [Helianthus annuus]